ncbi:MAG: class I SAM-dependent methyltransferase [Cyanobacteria bacterium P01_A01_bin.37]
MMSSKTVEHYDRHLGPVYAWMVGDFSNAAQQMTNYFDTIGLYPTETKLAVDLGCGHGVQTVPLADRGFAVTAIDSCQQLLETLQSNAGELPVDIIQANLLMFPDLISLPVDAIICMGDTVPHLASMDEVYDLISSVSKSLIEGGFFCASFRDYTSSELTGTSRFIPVRSDDQRIHTCFLEYSSDIVHVYDLLHTKHEGGWVFSASAYDKLRLNPQVFKDIAQTHNLDLVHEIVIRGMGYYAFQQGS